MSNMTGNYWPPNQNLLLFTDRSSQQQNNLISVEDYDVFYKQNRLANRKVNKKFITQDEHTFRAPAIESNAEGVIPIRDYGRLNEE